MSVPRGTSLGAYARRRSSATTHRCRTCRKIAQPITPAEPGVAAEAAISFTPSPVRSAQITCAAPSGGWVAIPTRSSSVRASFPEHVGAAGAAVAVPTKTAAVTVATATRGSLITARFLHRPHNARELAAARTLSTARRHVREVVEAANKERETFAVHAAAAESRTNLAWRPNDAASPALEEVKSRRSQGFAL